MRAQRTRPAGTYQQMQNTPRLLENFCTGGFRATSLCGLLCLVAQALAPQRAAAQTIYNIPPDSLPGSFQVGDIINVGPDGVIPQSFSVPPNVTLNIAGGMTEGNLSVIAGGQVNLLSGTIGQQSGTFGVARIAGGSVGFSFDASSGGTVIVTGGSLGFDYAGRSESETIIAGGTVSLGFNANAGSSVHFFGTDFTVGGSPVAGLNQSGDTVIVPQRTGDLEATLADGTTLLFPLAGPINKINADAEISLTLHLPGDLNHSGSVTIDDHAAWASDFGNLTASRGAGADHDFSGRVDLADFTRWRDNFGSGAASLEATNLATVPEPGAVMLMLGLIAIAARVRSLAPQHCHKPKQK